MGDETFMRFSLDAVTPEHDAPDPAKVIAGDPRFTTWNMETADDGKTFSGIWESTPGKWHMTYEEWEYCHILSGISIITPDGGTPQTVRAGDAFLLRRGFSGTWETVETTRKEYVIRL
ncbi:MAG: cupin domain-containing protein [Rhodobiaceae bacterium]|nr:cupin domain-containing protein [Paracoccaceae bacterium]MCB1474287.1 cupin domain-containing protein [Rhodobiaceae bacterium]MCC0053483.1 cupin domain-containing protein [Rhodobiaceae bacterium]